MTRDEVMDAWTDSTDGDPVNPQSQEWTEKNSLIAAYFTEAGRGEAREVLSRAISERPRRLFLAGADDSQKELLSRISSINAERMYELDEPRPVGEAKSQKAQRDRFEQQERLERKLLKRAEAILSTCPSVAAPLNLETIGAQVILEEMFRRRGFDGPEEDDALPSLRRLYDVYADATELAIPMPDSREGIEDQIRWLNLK